MSANDMSNGTEVVGEGVAGTALSLISKSLEPVALIAGLPSSLTYFAADLCRDLLARRHGACEVISLNNLESATVEKIGATSGPALFLCEVPDAAVAAMAKDAAFPILVLDHDFVAASYDFMAARNANLLDTARTMARAQMGLFALADISRAAVVRVDQHEAPALLAKSIAASLGMSREIVSDMIEARSLARPLTEVLDEIFVHEKLSRSDEMEDILQRLGRFYGSPLESRTALDVPMGMLLQATPPYQPATYTLELLGPARCLTFGPYLYLPRGRWRSNFTFLSLDNVSGNTIGMDVAADQEIKFDRDFDINVSGKFTFSSEFDIEDPFYPIEFRTFLRRGSIGGVFQPLSLTLETVARQ